MFTGIITDTAQVVSSEKQDSGLRMVFRRPKGWTDLAQGESIATNGVCLTVVSMDQDTYACELIPETLAVTSFGDALPESVNLERALKLEERLSGHLVQGHVDTVARVLSIDKNDGWRVMLGLNAEERRFIAYKGSVTVNGVSLTVAEVNEDNFVIALIPYTLEHTTLSLLKPGDLVNIEFDVIGKYVAQLMEEKK